jgi:hypothetical protein
LINSSSQYLSAPTVANFTYSTGDFTIECWVRFTTVGTQQFIIDQRNSGTATAIIPTIYLETTTAIVYYVNGAARITGAATRVANTWYHIAVARSGTSTKLFVNGAQDGTTYSDTNNYAASRFIAGSQANTVGVYLNGYMTGIRLSKGIARYTATFTVPSTPITSTDTYDSLIVQANNGGFFDLSNNGQLITNIATTISTTYNTNQITPVQKKFGTQSFLSSISGQYQTISNASTLQFGTGDFTIECWVYRSVAGSNHTIMSKGSSTGPTGFVLYINTSNQLLYGNSSILKTSTTTIPATTWTYVAITRSGTTGYMFINGTLEGAGYSDTYNYNQTDTLRIGIDRSTINGLVGYLDDIRITTGVCRYTATFSAPSTAFPTS